MQSSKDVEEYLDELLGTKGTAFRREFLTHWSPPRRVPALLGPLEGQILERPSQEELVLFRGDGGGGGSGKGATSSWNRMERANKVSRVRCSLMTL